MTHFTGREYGSAFATQRHEFHLQQPCENVEWVEHTCNPSTWEAESGGTAELSGQTVELNW